MDEQEKPLEKPPEKPVLVQNISERLRPIKKRMRVTRVTCSRTIRGKGGDTQVSFSTDLDAIDNPEGEQPGEIREGMTLREAELASYILGMQVDLVATEQAMAMGLLPTQTGSKLVGAIKQGYYQLFEKSLARGAK